MIRITIHQTGDDLVLGLEGCLGGAWAAALEACWLEKRAGHRGRKLRVDLRGVCRVDADGQALLARMYEDGVRFVTSGCVMPEIVREIADASRPISIERI